MADEMNQVTERVNAIMLDDSQVSHMKVAELKEELRRRDLRVYGRKHELVARLRAAMLLERDRAQGNDDKDENDDKDDDQDDDQDDDDANGGNQDGNHYDGNGRNKRRNATNSDNDDVDEDDEDDEDEETLVIRRKRRTSQRVLLTFKDVEGSLEKFDGDGRANVIRWLEDFEEMAALCSWNDIQKVAYAKRLLEGSAKLFVKYERCANTWKKLKNALKDEFEEVVDSLQIHRELGRRKKKQDESYQEYAYKMLEIASRANIETRAVIQYIIEGIPDEATNKAILYSAKTVKQLKECFVQYENMKRETLRYKTKQSDHKRNDNNDRKKPKDDKTDSAKDEFRYSAKVKRCYNCGATEHISLECPNKDKGAKCFKCNQYGHKAAECTGKPKEVYLISRPEKQKFQKEIEIKDCKILALVDTGSDLTLIRTNEYERIGSPTLTKRQVYFEGLGSAVNETLGEFTANISVGGEEFSVTFHVVSDAILKQSMILGADFLNRIELRLRRGKVTFLKLEDGDSTDVEDSEKPHIFKINVANECNEINLSHINKPYYREEIKTLIRNYEPKSIRDTGIQAKIIVKTDVPIVSRPRRLSHVEKPEVKEITNKWPEEGIIKPSNYEYASPIVLVRKRDGFKRLCVDYRKLNKVILRPLFPLQLVDDQIDSLEDAKIYSVLDLENGFFHVPVEKSSQKYTEIVTPDGQYEFTVTPFGLCISPAVFVKYISEVFKDLIQLVVIIAYMDDLIIRAKDEEEALDRLKLVLKVASEYGLRLKWSKCQFFKTTVEYLGHIVSRGTVKSSERKTEAVRKFVKPDTVKKLRSFLGLTGYFRKFIPKYSLIARPLTELLKNDVKFIVGSRENEAFEKLKAALVNGPVLKIYRVGAETELHTDASALGYGMILMQKDCNDGKFHPVYYASGKTSKAEAKYCSYELEVLAIVKAVEKFRIYLLGIHFKIITDCQAFTATMNKEKLGVRVARWVLALEEFNYEVCHRPGKNMNHVDALSRNPLPSTMLICENDDGLIARLRSNQGQDDKLKGIIDAVEQGEVNGYTVRNGLLYKNYDNDVLIVIPRSMQSQVVRQTHECGHFGVNLRLREDPNLRELVEEEWQNQFEDDREELRRAAKEKIVKMQEENRRNYDRRRKPATKYHYGELVAIKRTQFGPGLKLRGKYLGPYRINKTLRNDRYTVEKVGEHEGPQETSTSADHLKPWVLQIEDEDTGDSDAEDDI